MRPRQRYGTWVRWFQSLSGQCSESRRLMLTCAGLVPEKWPVIFREKLRKLYLQENDLFGQVGACSGKSCAHHFRAGRCNMATGPFTQRQQQLLESEAAQ
jgi:hypothetical protein